MNDLEPPRMADPAAAHGPYAYTLPAEPEPSNTGVLPQVQYVLVRPDQLMPRHPRVPQAYGVVHFFKRLIGIVLNAATIIMCGILAAKWSPKADYAGAGIATAVIMLFNDGAQCVALLDASRTVPRAHPLITGLVDFLGLAGFILLAFFLGVSDWNHPGKPWADDMYLCVAMLGASAGLRFIYLIWNCADGCAMSGKRKRARKLNEAINGRQTACNGRKG